MVQDSMFKLFSKSDKYYMRLLSGDALGRRLNVWDLFRNYFQQFSSIGIYLFSYNVWESAGLNISDRFFHQIEKRLFYFGRAGAVKHNNDLTAVNVSQFGQDIYNEPTNFSFVFGGGIADDTATPFERDVDKDGVYIKNTFNCYPTAMITEQYALMLAHCDMSIIAELVNSRFMDVLKAGDNRTAESAEKFNKDLYEGRLSFISDISEEMEVNRSARGVSRLRDYIDCKTGLLKDFYNIFGINKTLEKRERMITDEVEDNKELLLFNVKDMYEMRKKMCDDMREVFGVDIEVTCHVDIDRDGKTEEPEEMEGESNAI